MLDEINDDLDNAVDVVAVLQNNSNVSNNDGPIPQLTPTTTTTAENKPPEKYQVKKPEIPSKIPSDPVHSHY